VSESLDLDEIEVDAKQARLMHGERFEFNDYCKFCDRRWPCEPLRQARTILQLVSALRTAAADPGGASCGAPA
jgi:hypothetical protein